MMDKGDNKVFYIIYEPIQCSKIYIIKPPLTNQVQLNDTKFQRKFLIALFKI